MKHPDDMRSLRLHELALVFAAGVLVLMFAGFFWAALAVAVLAYGVSALIP